MIAAMGKGKAIKYSDEEMRWLQENHKMIISDYYHAFVKRFGRDDVSQANLHNLRKRRRWKTGRSGRFTKGQRPANLGKKMPFNANSARTQFKKGQTPKNKKPIGHERLTKDGYIMMSVPITNPHTGANRHFVLKHRWLWEEKNGAVPEGKALKCLDGNRKNCDPNNWEAVPLAFLARLSGIHGRNYDQAPADLKPVIMTVTKLEHKLHQGQKSDE